MARVNAAQPPGSQDMGSFGRADGMLIVQHNFPDHYDEGTDRITGAYSDRMRGWDTKHFQAMCEKHLKEGVRGFGGIGHHLHKKTPEQILEFFVEILKADPEEGWTGYRLTGSVNLSNGYPVYFVEIFANRSGVPVYSGGLAPNIHPDGWRAPQDRDGEDWRNAILRAIVMQERGVW